MSMAAPSAQPVVAPRDDPRYVLVVQPNDVVMGRGAPTRKLPGNILFRQVIASHKAAYNSTGRQHAKQLVAKQAYHQVMEHRLRFLRKAEPSQKEEWGIPQEQTVYTVYDNKETIVNKIKQALREHDTESDKDYPEHQGMVGADMPVAMGDGAMAAPEHIARRDPIELAPQAVAAPRGVLVHPLVPGGLVHAGMPAARVLLQARIHPPPLQPQLPLSPMAIGHAAAANRAPIPVAPVAAAAGWPRFNGFNAGPPTLLEQLRRANQGAAANQLLVASLAAIARGNRAGGLPHPVMNPMNGAVGGLLGQPQLLARGPVLAVPPPAPRMVNPFNM